MWTTTKKLHLTHIPSPAAVFFLCSLHGTVLVFSVTFNSIHSPSTFSWTSFVDNCITASLIFTKGSYVSTYLGAKPPTSSVGLAMWLASSNRIRADNEAGECRSFKKHVKFPPTALFFHLVTILQPKVKLVLQPGCWNEKLQGVTEANWRMVANP
jgi:hypothetical protein